MCISGCINCFERIGGEEHVPVDREGHFRILKNQSQQNQVVGISKRNWFNGRIFRQKTIQDLKKLL